MYGFDESKKNKLKEYFEFYENEILPKIRTIPEVTQNDYGYHGLLTHTEGVVFRGIFFSVYIDKNPYPVIFACAGHDLARINEGPDALHGRNAVPIVSKLMDMFDDLLTEKEKEQVKYAVAHHTGGEKAPDYVSACLWDADRCRLAWEGGFNDKYFNTKIGKEIASNRAEDFLKFENECLGRDETTDKENVIRTECGKDIPDEVYDMIVDD